MRTRKWIAVAGGVILDTFEWHDGEGNYGRCLKVRTDELREKAEALYDEEVLIEAYYPKDYEKTGALGVLVNIRKTTEEDRYRHFSFLEENWEGSDFE